VKVAVGNNIPQPGYLFPRDSRVAGFNNLGQVLYRLTDYFKIPDYGILGAVICKELLVGHSF